MLKRSHSKLAEAGADSVLNAMAACNSHARVGAIKNLFVMPAWRAGGQRDRE